MDVNVATRFKRVNTNFKKLAVNFGAFLALGALGSSVYVPTAQAETPRELAILNATEITNMLQGVDRSRLPALIEALKEGRFARYAPDQPVWIMESVNGTILYYQGQDSFEGQPASKLIDDKGFRFGSKALDNAALSKPTWLSIDLNGVTYNAYCYSMHPTVVCSLIPTTNTTN